MNRNVRDKDSNVRKDRTMESLSNLHPKAVKARGSALGGGSKVSRKLLAKCTAPAPVPSCPHTCSPLTSWGQGHWLSGKLFSIMHTALGQLSFSLTGQ